MAAKRKYVILKGRRKRAVVHCPGCGQKKTIEARKSGTQWRICGASELTSAKSMP